MTDAPDVDFDRLNEEQSSHLAERFQVNEAQSGLSTHTVHPAEAFKYFRELHSVKEKVLESPEGALLSTKGEIEQLELPQYRIERLQRELDILEEELRELEKQEIQSSFFGLESESVMQLKEVSFLKEQVKNVADSEAFKQFEGNLSALQSDSTQDRNYEDKINQAVESILSQQYAQLDGTTDGTIHLHYDPSLSHLGLQETELQKEQDKKYRQLVELLDTVESKVGVWNPSLKFVTIQQALDKLCEKSDVLEEKVTVDFIGIKGKELNKDFDSLIARLRGLGEIDYDQAKLDYLYGATEKALECEHHVELILERLRALEQIHKDGPVS
ncbi:hypothetical protein FGO68_gene17279 [Halteria grandinella]|uniref:Uncharacterized protein n=1 Tax=Halteria grandinella TaxID=5974 RepID=A0A8J8NZJ9_HALGN|nr:hypothetical protein FGO68_gene17279 [Halteria grandinella]